MHLMKKGPIQFTSLGLWKLGNLGLTWPGSKGFERATFFLVYVRGHHSRNDFRSSFKKQLGMIIKHFNRGCRSIICFAESVQLPHHNTHQTGLSPPEFSTHTHSLGTADWYTQSGRYFTIWMWNTKVIENKSSKMYVFNTRNVCSALWISNGWPSTRWGGRFHLHIPPSVQWEASMERSGNRESWNTWQLVTLKVVE